MDSLDTAKIEADLKIYNNLPHDIRISVDRMLARAFRRGLKEGRHAQEIVDVSE